jgi:hypothetical protein
MDKFLHTYDLSKLNLDDRNNLNRSIMSNELKTIIKSLPTKKIPEPDGFTTELHQTFNELYTNDPQTIPQNTKGSNTFKLILRKKPVLP